MFKFLRTVAEALGRAGLKVMTNGVRADWLSVPGGILDISLGGEVRRGPSYPDPV